MLRNLDRRYCCSWYNYKENFQSIYADTQFLLMDEFTIEHIKPTSMNLIADGSYMYPVKGEDSFNKVLTVIICGNRDPREIYPTTY